MPDSYAGNSANYPANITRPIGTDLAVAASVRAALTQLADRTANTAAATGGLSAAVGDLDVFAGQFNGMFATWAFGSLTNGAGAVSFDVSVSASWTAVAYSDFGYVKDDFIRVTAGPIVAHCASTGYVAIGFSDDLGVTWARAIQIPVVGMNETMGWTAQDQYRIANSDGSVRVAFLVKASASDHIAGNGFGAGLTQWGSFEILRQFVAL